MSKIFQDSSLKIMRFSFWFFAGEETAFLISVWVLGHFQVSCVWNKKLNLFRHWRILLMFCGGFCWWLRVLTVFCTLNGLRYICLCFYAVLSLHKGPTLWFSTVFGQQHTSTTRKGEKIRSPVYWLQKYTLKTVALPTYRCHAVLHYNFLCSYIL